MAKKKKKNSKKTKFNKKIVTFCIAFIVIYTIYQTYISQLIGSEVTPTLTTCVYAFFGTELAVTALIRIFDKDENTKYTKDNSNKTVG